MDLTLNRWDRRISSLKSDPTMTVTSSGIFFNQKVLELLNDPEYVQTYSNASGDVLVVRPCKRNDESSLKFFRGERSKGARFTNRLIVEDLTDQMDWNIQSYNYRTVGQKEEGVGNGLVFYLKDATKVNKKRKK